MTDEHPSGANIALPLSRQVQLYQEVGVRHLRKIISLRTDWWASTVMLIATPFVIV